MLVTIFIVPSYKTLFIWQLITAEVYAYELSNYTMRNSSMVFEAIFTLKK